MRLICSAFLVWLLAGLQTLVLATDRPDEDSLFGAPAAVGVAGEVSNQAPAPKIAGTQSQDARGLESANPERNAFASGEVKDNPLQLGGTYYQQWIAAPLQGDTAADTALSAPLQVDGYMDAQPSDRVRGFLNMRLIYDPTRDSNSNPTSGKGLANLAGFGGNTGTAQPNPQVVLDQAWLKFDIERSIFVTAGKQHLKWGVSHFWNPTDFLTPRRLDPLQPYDLRLGANLLKLNLPWEAARSNVYAVAVFDNPVPASTLGQMGGALRAESVLGGAEIGVDAVARGGLNPAFGADVSAPLGPLDVYAEAAFLTGSSFNLNQLAAVPAPGSDLSAVISSSSLAGPVVQASGGLNYSFGWKENRQATVGAEYFYNELGAENANVYPLLIFQGKYQPFYLGKHYAGVYVTAEGPDADKKTSYTFSTISNISDASYISRLDFTWIILTYLTFGAYADVHFGTLGGEFNFSLNTPEVKYRGSTMNAINLPSTPYDLGLSLRLSL